MALHFTLDFYSFNVYGSTIDLPDHVSGGFAELTNLFQELFLFLFFVIILGFSAQKVLSLADGVGGGGGVVEVWTPHPTSWYGNYWGRVGCQGAWQRADSPRLVGLHPPEGALLAAPAV